jgi:hypothetical protein
MLSGHWGIRSRWSGTTGGWTIADLFGPIEFDLVTGERRPLAGILAGQFCDADGEAVV